MTKIPVGAPIKYVEEVFLVFFRRIMPSRPTPFLAYAYEYAKDSGRVIELPEAKETAIDRKRTSSLVVAFCCYRT